MKTDWTFRGDALDDDVRERVEQQLNKLDRFFREPAEARVVVAHEGHQRIDIEIVVSSASAGPFAARSESHDAADAARSACQSVEAQIHRAHDKKLEGRRKSPPVVSAPEEIV